MSQRNLAAILIDFENTYYYLKNNAPEGDITKFVLNLIRSLKEYLAVTFDEHVLSMDAYADFDRIEEAPQSDLYLLGVEPHHVLGTDHKNAADMRLCIDTLDILYNRREINSFVLVAGDRDYIPVIQYLKKQNRVVRVVGFPRSVSGDLLTVVGNEFFIDATQFVGDLFRPKGQGAAIAPDGATLASAALVTARPVVRHSHSFQVEEGTFDWEKFETQAIELLLTHFKGKPEVWLTPYLHKLRAGMSELTEWQRKELISRLDEKGIFQVEKREGTPNDYSVLVVNWNHPVVRASNPGM